MQTGNESIHVAVYIEPELLAKIEENRGYEPRSSYLARIIRKEHNGNC